MTTLNLIKQLKIGNGNEREAKRTRCRSSVTDNLEYDKETTAGTGDAEEWPYSSEEEALDEALSHDRDHEGVSKKIIYTLYAYVRFTPNI